MGPVWLALECEEGKHAGWEGEVMRFNRKVYILEGLRQVCLQPLCCNSPFWRTPVCPTCPLAALAGETWATGHVAGLMPKTPTHS